MTAPRLTGVRQEVKYLLSPDEGEGIKAAVGARMGAKVVNGSPFSYRVSVYLDLPGRPMAKRGLKYGSQTTKLRVKDYYLLDGPRPIHSGSCWVEVKTRAGSMVEKSRFPVPRFAVKEVVSSGVTISLSEEHDRAVSAFEEAREGQPLTPLFVAHYCRWTFQDKDAKVRITLDNGATYHLPPAGIFSDRIPICSRQQLPPPLAVEKRWIMEVKSLGLGPSWISEIISGRETVEYSKFVSGITAVKAAGKID